jgi:hypothetical protein
LVASWENGVAATQSQSIDRATARRGRLHDYRLLFPRLTSRRPSDTRRGKRCDVRFGGSSSTRTAPAPWQCCISFPTRPGPRIPFCAHVSSILTCRPLSRTSMSLPCSGWAMGGGGERLLRFRCDQHQGMVMRWHRPHSCRYILSSLAKYDTECPTREDKRGFGLPRSLCRRRESSLFSSYKIRITTRISTPLLHEVGDGQRMSTIQCALSDLFL